MGGATRWWLHGSLAALDESLRRAGSRLLLLRRPALEALEAVVSATGASAIFWNRRYGAAEIALDSTIKKRLTDRGLKVQSFNGRLLNEPWQVLNRSGKPFQVFTPYLRAVMARPVGSPLPAPQAIPDRIFNPVAQGEKFDPDGAYVRNYVPELTKLPAAFIHKPWETPVSVLKDAGVELGKTYPAPVVAHGPARERALAAFRNLRDNVSSDHGSELDP